MSEKILIKTLIGSRAIGIASEDSDYDWAEVFIPEKSILLGLKAEKIYSKHSEEEDSSRYPIQKFLYLCYNNNPSILDILFSPENHWQTTSAIWKNLIYPNRHKFLSKAVANTYIGYATSQLKRIETHRSWLLNPPKKKPLRPDFGLPECTTIVKEYRQAMLSLPDKFINSDYQEIARKELAYDSTKKNWDMYERWKRERNPERAELEAKFGYDTKHAVHLFRLLIQGCEILEHKELRVDRTEIDASMLRGVRNGYLTYDQLMKKVTELQDKIHKAEETSTLPDKPDYEMINNLCIEIVEQSLR